MEDVIVPHDAFGVFINFPVFYQSELSFSGSWSGNTGRQPVHPGHSGMILWPTAKVLVQVLGFCNVEVTPDSPTCTAVPSTVSPEGFPSTDHQTRNKCPATQLGAGRDTLSLCPPTSWEGCPFVGPTQGLGSASGQALEAAGPLQFGTRVFHMSQL